MKKLTIQLETLTCPSCLQKINAAVKKVDGVNSKSVEVLFNTSRVRLDYDKESVNIKDVTEAIEKVGYKVLRTSIK